MDHIARELIGAAAACCTTFSFVPQALRIVRTRDTTAISLPMYLVFGVGIALWLLYGVLCVSWPIIAANTVTLALVTVIIALKLRFG